MAEKKSAFYQSRYRDRLKNKGLVKKECWIPPKYATILKHVELALRQGIVPIVPSRERRDAMAQETWNTTALFEALLASDEVKSGVLSVNLIEGEEPVIEARVADLGEFPSFVTVSGEQILAMTHLWRMDEVAEQFRADLNEELLRANTLVPLSDFAIVDNNYVLFGALSVESPVSEVITEIITLSENVVEAFDTYGEQLFG